MDANVRRERPVLGGILLAAGLCVVLALWFGRACRPGSWPANPPSSDDTYMLGTIYERWAAQVKDGRPPLWFAEFGAGGQPVHAAWMYGLFYPPIALFLALPPETAWTWLSILHVVFGALGMYAFLWDERRDETAAACGAVVFALSNFMIGRILAGHLNLVMPLAWAPWTLCAAGRTSRGVRGASAWLGICAGMGLLAGHVQIWFYAAPAVAAFAVFEARRHGTLRAAAPRLLFAAAIALAISAIQWVPAWELFSASGHPPEDRSIVRDCSAPAAALVAQIAPRLWTSDERFPHEFTGLGGPLAVAAALYAFEWRDRRRWFWFAVLAAGLVLAMGLRNDVSEFANELPPFRFARAPGRAMALVVLAGGVLAAHATADLLAAASSWRRLAPAAFVASALAFGVPSVDVVKSDFYEFDWTSALPPGAKSHRVHVLRGRYPYLERFGFRTIRDVCPVETPGFRVLAKDLSPAIAWWFDIGAQIEVPWPQASPADRAAADAVPRMGPPPADRAATEAMAAGAAVGAYEAFGRARLSQGAPFDMAEADAWTAVRRGEKTALLDEPDAAPGRAASFRCVRLGGALQPTRDEPGDLEFDVDARGAAWIVVSEKRYPGWTAAVDGAPVATHLATAMFLCAEVPAGRHRVEFAYRPWWKWPAILGGVGAFLCAVAAAVRAARLSRGTASAAASREAARSTRP